MVDESHEPDCESGDEHGEELYGATNFEGELSNGTRKDAMRVKRWQMWMAFVEFIFGLAVAGAFVFFGIDETSGEIELKYRGGVFRGSIAGLTVVATTYLSHKIATDDISVRGKK